MHERLMSGSHHSRLLSRDVHACRGRRRRRKHRGREESIIPRICGAHGSVHALSSCNGSCSCAKMSNNLMSPLRMRKCQGASTVVLLGRCFQPANGDFLMLHDDVRENGGNFAPFLPALDNPFFWINLLCKLHGTRTRSKEGKQGNLILSILDYKHLFS